MKQLLQNTEYYENVKNLMSKGHFPCKPDEWPSSAQLQEADSFDIEYFGNGTMRILTGQDIIPTLAIKIHVTGRKVQYSPHFHNPMIRVEVEFLKDGEPSDFSGGWLYL